MYLYTPAGRAPISLMNNGIVFTNDPVTYYVGHREKDD